MRLLFLLVIKAVKNKTLGMLRVLFLTGLVKI